jgi:methyl-accepting chemotaxis protein
MPLGRLLKGAGLILLAALMLLVAVSSYSMFRLTIGSPAHRELVMDREIISEISLPSLSTMGAYIQAARATNGGRETAETYIGRLRDLKALYDERLTHWLSVTSEDKREYIEDMTGGAAVRFWAEVADVFIPALEAGQTEAARASLVRLGNHYFDQQDETAVVMEAIAAAIVAEQGAAMDAVAVAKLVSWGIMALALGLLLMVGRAATLLIRKPLETLTETTRRLAARDYDMVIPFAGAGSEVGQMATALAELRDAARQAGVLEAEAAERNRLAALEAERTMIEHEDAAAAFGQALGRFVDGDLTARVDAEVSDAYATIKRDLNIGLERVRESLAGVKVGTGSIRSMTEEIANASEDLSRRTESQAANLEQTAAAVEEITATVKAAAEGATHARQVVSATKSDAVKSGEVVGRAVEAMSAIEESSRQIGQIIGVIDGIAFQTNLLALNAGVEAARAGEAGRGFAVVATEVRALAQRSAEAARQIKDLISTSTVQVDQGVNLVGETGEALGRIVTAVSEVNDLVTTIAASAAEQSAGLAQINVAIAQMDQITQQNAAMVEETTAAARALAAQTEDVATQIDRFRTADGPQDVAAATRPSGAPAVRADARAKTAHGRPERAQKLLRVAGGASRPVKDDGWEEF